MSKFKPAIREPVGLIGAGDAAPGGNVYETARLVARRLAEAGLVILCGGRTGVMEAACLGAHEGGGISIALLPAFDTEPNPYATIVLATDLGRQIDPIHAGPPEVSRNRVIAGASKVLVAVGGGAGTANETGHALAFGKTVYGLCGAPDPVPPPPDGVGAHIRGLDTQAVAAAVLEVRGMTKLAKP